VSGKRPILAVYDYGQGGIWLIIDARTPQEVAAKYPMLTVPESKPDWMTRTEGMDYLSQIEKSGRHYDIDSPPTGWLKSLVDETAK
jgi:hypothetical protein